MTTFTWNDVLDSIRKGEKTVPAAPNGIPVVAVNAPFFELMQLMEALTTGYNNLVALATKDQQRIERIRKLAQAAFPGDKVAPADGWISVDDMLPSESGCYMCWDATHPLIRPYAYDFSAKYGLFNAHDHTTLEQAQKTAVHVTHWYPTAKPPVLPE